MKKKLHPIFKNSLYILLLSLVTFASCKKESQIGFTAPDPYFTYDESYAFVDEEITFKNLSENATTYEWDFGDGNTSSEENPIHTYVKEGEYTLTLVAAGEGGEVKEKSTIVIKKQTVQGNWILLEAIYDGVKLDNASGFFNITDEENYNAQFVNDKNTGKATAKYTKFSPLFLTNIDSKIAIINGKSASGTSSMQLWATEIFCDKTVYNNYLMTGLGMGKPELSFKGRCLILKSSDGKAKLKYQKE